MICSEHFGEDHVILLQMVAKQGLLRRGEGGRLPPIWPRGNKIPLEV